MENSLALAAEHPLARPSTLADTTVELLKHSQAKATFNAYSTDWDQFSAWCDKTGVAVLPAMPETVANYVLHLSASYKVASIARKLASISVAHQAAGMAENPTRSFVVKRTIRALRRTHDTVQKQAVAAVAEEIVEMVKALRVDDSLAGLRSSSLILLGMAGALRRSEIIALDVEHLTWSKHGVAILIARSKTDQEGQGAIVGIPYGSNLMTCPVSTLSVWIERAGITSGALFRAVNKHGQIQGERLSDQTVGRIVKAAVSAIGKDATSYSAHSLRAGFATSAVKAGKSATSIKAQGRWKSNTWERYVRHETVWQDNAAAGIGL